MKSITLNIGGDLFLGRGVEPIACANPDSLFDTKIMDLFANSDFNILNLESPLTNAGDRDKIDKTGPNLKASPETIGVLNVLKTNLVTLANNHIYDYGYPGLSDTLELCDQNKINTVGAGRTLDEAKKIFLKKFETFSIAVVNIAENEWCNANGTMGGANPMDFIANMRSIEEAKKLADFVILIIHGGHELFYYPSPRMVDAYRFFAEQGVSLIVSHHSHFISGNETYKNVPIFYGLGNFLFDANSSSNGWSEGLLLNLQIDVATKGITWRLLPFKQCRGTKKVELLDGIEKADIEKKIESINSIISDKEKLKEKFDLLVNHKTKEVLSMLSTSYFLKYKYLRSAVRKLGLENIFLRRQQLKSILNHVRCEAHRDITFEVLNNYLNSNGSPDL